MDVPEGRYIPISWVGLEEMPLEFANQFVCQFQPDEFMLSLGSLAPPMLLGDPEEKQRQLEQLAYVPVKPIARIAMTPSRMRELIQVLQENLAQYESAMDTQEQSS